MKIIGGVYAERCQEPEWDQVFGSGLRAAVACVEIAKKAQKSVELISWLAKREERDVQLRAESFGVTLEPRESHQTIEFEWTHGLAKPMMFYDGPKVLPLPQCDVIHAKNALMFGLVEDQQVGTELFTPRVLAVKLVYDPQGEESAIPWSMTKCKADRVVMVLNLVEAQAIAKKMNIEFSDGPYAARDLGKSLVEKEQLEAIIIKNGAEGAFVVTKYDSHFVPSYKTKKVFPIGTGDVYSAVFAILWAECDVDVVEAATQASKATAYYTETQSLPIPGNLKDFERELTQHEIPKSSDKTHRRKVYLAGPLFNFPQRWFITELKKYIERHGVEVFSPLHEVGMMSDEIDVSTIAREDLEGLKGCHSVFAILDGLDAGTLFEVGYATAKEIPVIGFRQTASDSDLTMILGSENCTVFSDLPTAVYHAAWAALESGEKSFDTANG